MKTPDPFFKDCHSPALEGIRRSMRAAQEIKTDLTSNLQSKAISELVERIREEHHAYIGRMSKEENKEDNTMKVSYKGITGELIRLERIEVPCSCSTAHPYKWELNIYDREKDCKVSFSGVSMKDVKFMGGEVTYG